jgi:hypothetical protein
MDMNASDQEAAREEIQEGPLSVLIRDGWRQPGQAADEGVEEFEILLSTGGPALRLYGKLGRYGEPEDAELTCGHFCKSLCSISRVCTVISWPSFSSILENVTMVLPLGCAAR